MSDLLPLHLWLLPGATAPARLTSAFRVTLIRPGEPLPDAPLVVPFDAWNPSQIEDAPGPVLLYLPRGTEPPRDAPDFADAVIREGEEDRLTDLLAHPARLRAASWAADLGSARVARLALPLTPDDLATLPLLNWVRDELSEDSEALRAFNDALIAVQAVARIGTPPTPAHLLPYLQGHLEPDAVEWVRAHLARSAALRAALEGLRHALAAGGPQIVEADLPTPAAGAGTAAAVLVPLLAGLLRTGLRPRYAGAYRGREIPTTNDDLQPLFDALLAEVPLDILKEDERLLTLEYVQEEGLRIRNVAGANGPFVVQLLQEGSLLWEGTSREHALVIPAETLRSVQPDRIVIRLAGP